MATRAFSIEDGNLATKSILTTQKRTYKDIDLSFAKKTTGEIFKKRINWRKPELHKIYVIKADHTRTNTCSRKLNIEELIDKSAQKNKKIEKIEKKFF